MSDGIIRRREARGSGVDTAQPAGGALPRQRHGWTPDGNMARSRFTSLRQRSRASVSCAAALDGNTGLQSHPLGAPCGATRFFGID